MANSQFLIDFILKNNHHNIVSFGAGATVKENLLKLTLRQKFRVVATDFDAFIVDKAKGFFPEITVKQFDFC